MIKRYGLGVLIWGAFLIWNHAHALELNEPRQHSVSTLARTYEQGAEDMDNIYQDCLDQADETRLESGRASDREFIESCLQDNL